MMSEFASGTMMRVIHRSLKDQGIATPAAGRPVPRVDLRHKQGLLERIEEAHGLGPILSIGLHISSFAMEPTGMALLAADSPADLVHRWQRLERFVHSRHSVECRSIDSRRLSLKHVSLSDAPPSDAENLLIAGLIAGMIRQCGARRLVMTIAGVPSWEDGAVLAVPRGDETADWQYAWESFEPAATPTMKGLRYPEQLQHLVEADCARRWTVKEIAKTMGLSSRSLQRHLGPEGGFVATTAKVRAGQAAKLLRTTQLSLAETGFASGFSDQPHFNREFRRFSGMTPGQYRMHFGIGAEGT